MSTKRTERGYTMLELGFVLATLGVLIVIAMNFRGPKKDRVTQNAADFQSQIIASVEYFAAHNFRLPCADTDGNGYEGAGTPGGCGVSDTTYIVGGVPFKTLGLNVPTTLGNGFEKRFIYGVYRKANVDPALDSDLARLVERTGDAAGDSEYLRLYDLKKGLRNAAATLPPPMDTNRIHVTGDDGATGAMDCATNQVMNVAFFVVYGGDKDADANGSLFDGANNLLTWPSGGSRCVAGPDKNENLQYDDTVRAVGFSELLGSLTH